MRLGLVHINMGPMSHPDAVVRAARAAEGAGFDSVWAGEHLVLPDPRVPPSPMAPQDPALDSLLALTWAAAHTTTIRLATGIVILPQRNPVVLAKQVATLDVLSGGRVMLGAGAGYLEPEFRAVGANFAERGAVTDEYLDAMRALWYDEHPRYHGRFASFSGVDAYPRPVQQPVPLIVGGHSGPAYRRAVARGQGWYGYWLTPAQAAASVAGLAEAAQSVQRPAGSGPLEISVTPRGRMTPALAAEFAEAGVDRLVLLAPPAEDGAARTIEAGLAAVDGLRLPARRPGRPWTKMAARPNRMTERKPAEISFASWIDRQISEAQERGAFDNLPGAGKPLPKRALDGDAWLRDYLDREGVSAEEMLPVPLRLRKEAERLPDTLRGLRSEQDVRDIVRDLNRRILEWRRVPVGPPVVLRLVDEDAMVTRWQEAQPKPAAPPPPRPEQPPSPRWWRRRSAD